MPKFAANLSVMFTDVPFPERFKRAADAGFSGVECQFPYEWLAQDIAALLEAYQLHQVLINMPAGDWDAGDRGLACLTGRTDEFTADIERAIQYARVLGCRNIHMMSGVMAQDTSFDLTQTTYRQNICLVADRLAGEGLNLLIEPINHRDMPGYFLNTTTQAQAHIVAASRSNIKLQFDIYHCHITEGKVAARIGALSSITGHYQIAGYPGRHEPDNGEIDYPDLFRQIDATGYIGWIGCEYRPKGKTEDGLNWFAENG